MEQYQQKCPYGHDFADDELEELEQIIDKAIEEMNEYKFVLDREVSHHIQAIRLMDKLFISDKDSDLHDYKITVYRKLKD